jgi:hypothetical protein
MMDAVGTGFPNSNQSADPQLMHLIQHTRSEGIVQINSLVTDRSE